jgi:hypothetical protein
METQVHVLYLGMMAPTSPLLPTLSLSLSSLCVEVEVYQKKLSGVSPLPNTRFYGVCRNYANFLYLKQ